MRTFDQRTVLDMFAARITAVSLSGYLFFGRWALSLSPTDMGIAQLASCAATRFIVVGRLQHRLSFTQRHLSCCSLLCCSSVTVVERVLSIASSTLDTQPHLPLAEQAQNAAAAVDGDQLVGRLASLPSSATLSRTYDNVAVLADRLSGA